MLKNAGIEDTNTQLQIVRTLFDTGSMQMN